MKYVFFGSPRFAAIVLEGLIAAGTPPTAVVCNPDRPVGRKKIITAPPTREIALREKIKVLQPEVLDESFSEKLTDLQPDFFIVAAYAKILPKAVLAIPRLGTLGTHPSLLPKYRGASPLQSVILNGETETGATIYRMDEKMDHGPILNAGRIPLDSLITQYPALEGTLAELSAQLLTKTISQLLDGSIAPQVQDEAKATYTKKFKTVDGFVTEEELTAAEQGDEARSKKILHMINAFTPEPGCWTTRNGKRVKLLEAKLSGTRLILTTTQTEGERAKTLR